MHSQEKRHAFKLRLDQDVSVPKASYAEGISSSTGYRWRDQFRHEELKVRHEDLEVRFEDLEVKHGKLEVRCEGLEVAKELLLRDKNLLMEKNRHLRSRNWKRAIMRWLASAIGASIIGDILDAVVEWMKSPSSPPSEAISNGAVAK